MKLKNFFAQHPVFRYEEFAQFMIEHGVSRPASWRQQLSYHHKVGNIIRIRKSLYAVKPPFVNRDQLWIDPLLIAGQVSPNAIISHHSALELHGLAYTSFEEHIFLTEKPSKSFNFQGQTFRPVIYPKVLVEKGRVDDNVISIERQGIIIRVTDIERTVVDVLDRPDLSGGWEEVWRSLEHLVQFDPEKLIHYTLLLGNATIVAKVGFFLEQRPKHLAVNPIYIEQLLPHIPKQAHYRNRARKGRGKYFKRWHLVVPLEIVERQWEEPHVDDI